MPEIPAEYLNWVPPPGYKTQSEDTSPQVERFLFDILSRLPLSEKGARARKLNVEAELFALAGLRSMFPDASKEEIRLRLAARRLGREAMIAAYGWDPEAH